MKLPHDQKLAEFYNVVPKILGFGLKFGASAGSILTKLFQAMCCTAGMI